MHEGRPGRRRRWSPAHRPASAGVRGSAGRAGYRLVLTARRDDRLEAARRRAPAAAWRRSARVIVADLAEPDASRQTGRGAGIGAGWPSMCWSTTPATAFPGSYVQTSVGAITTRFLQVMVTAVLRAHASPAARHDRARSGAASSTSRRSPAMLPAPAGHTLYARVEGVRDPLLRIAARRARARMASTSARSVPASPTANSTTSPARATR